MNIDPEAGGDKHMEFQSRDAEIAAVSRKGLRRCENQDRFGINELADGSLLLLIADGMGGENGGGHAASLVESVFREAGEIPVGAEHQSLEKLVRTADAEILKAAGETPALEGMGTTLTAVLIRNLRTFWIHVGDSRLYLHQGTAIEQITSDQTFARFLLTEGEITQEEFAGHYSRNMLDQCVGHGVCEPDTGTFGLAKEDLLFLSSDGLHGRLDMETIRSVLNAKSGLKVRTQHLADKAIRAGSGDDITAVTLAVH